MDAGGIGIEGEANAMLQQPDPVLAILPAAPFERLIPPARLEDQRAWHRRVSVAEIDVGPEVPGLAFAAKMIFPPPAHLERPQVWFRDARRVIAKCEMRIGSISMGGCVGREERR